MVRDEPTQSKVRSAPPMNTGPSDLGAVDFRACRFADRFVKVFVPIDDAVGAEDGRHGLLMGIAGGGEDSAPASQGPDGRDGEQSNGAATDHEHRFLVRRKRPQHGVQAAAERLDQDRFLVGEAAGYLVDLEGVRHQRSAPPASGVPAVSRLYPRGEVAVHDPFAQAEVTIPARRTRRVDAPNGAAETGFDHHAVSPCYGPGTGPRFQDLAHDLVPQDERRRDQRREIGTAPGSNGGQVRSADPAQQRPDAYPLGGRQRGWIDVRHANARQRSGGQGGAPVAECTDEQVPGHALYVLYRFHAWVQ